MFDKNVLNDEEMASLPPYLAYKQGSENLSANIATHLANGLQLFQDDQLCRVLSTDDIDLILPGKEPCAYYCVFPDDHDTVLRRPVYRCFSRCFLLNWSILQMINQT